MKRHAKRQVYCQKSRTEKRRHFHDGQRKLFLSELAFLTECVDDSPKRQLVVYVGCSPGNHIDQLISMFPTLDFDLFDREPLVIPLGPRVRYFPRFFTDDDARQYAGRDVLFISDVRGMAMGERSDEIIEAAVVSDNASTIRWHALMQPRMSIIKFRLPFAPGVSNALSGSLQFQAWSGATSTETRLVCGRSPCFSHGGVRAAHAALAVYLSDSTDCIARAALGIVAMDHTKYEERMMYFNSVTRNQQFECCNGLVKFDVAMETDIWQEYFHRTNSLQPHDQQHPHRDDPRSQCEQHRRRHVPILHLERPRGHGARDGRCCRHRERRDLRLVPHQHHGLQHGPVRRALLREQPAILGPPRGRDGQLDGRAGVEVRVLQRGLDRDLVHAELARDRGRLPRGEGELRGVPRREEEE